MNSVFTFGIIFVILLVLELAYFMVADHFNIIDKPNERSSHSSIVLRGGGIIFLIGAWVWAIASLISDEGLEISDCYPFFLIALTLVAGVSFVDDIKSLPDSVRLVCQFVAMALMFYQVGMIQWNLWWLIILGFVVCVGASNIINFMDGINGITGGYSLAVLIPLMLVNSTMNVGFIDQSFLIVAIISVVVFCIFNFRPRGKAKCFAGDVGSIGIAYILLFSLGKLVLQTEDLTYFVFLIVYGVDGVLTICHRIMLHENLGEAHRKHAYQLMCNELGMSHVTVSCIYMLLQLAVGLGFIYLCPNTITAHWIYLLSAFVVLAVAYLLFKKKYYHLHEEYLASLKK